MKIVSRFERFHMTAAFHYEQIGMVVNFGIEQCQWMMAIGLGLEDIVEGRCYLVLLH